MAIRRSIQLSTWFPSDDPIAAAVARLCILREDFYLEALALAADRIDILDENDAAWRRIYFLRQLTVTLMEAKGAMIELQKSSDFRSALGKAGMGFREEVKQLVKILDAGELKQIRNNVGGHIGQKGMQQVLKALDTEVEALLEVGTTHRQTHYKFTSELMARMLTIHMHGKEDKLVTFERIGTLMTVKLLDAIDRVITAYCDLKKLE
jgi:hypothetical protein